MASMAEVRLREALRAYGLGYAGYAERCGAGHINDTFLVNGVPPRFIVQRISRAAFKHPDQLMANIVGVTEYIKKVLEEQGGDPERETLSIVRTSDGASYYTDSEGYAWRCMPYIEDSVCYQSVKHPELFREAARAFGNFQRMLKDYPADTLFETIEGFHDTPKRFESFKSALEKDALDRAKDVGPEVEFILAREQDCAVALDAQKRGEIPLRVTHNDTKLNNILFDRKTGKGLCVIDLDTVMPGLAINDFGDAIRFGANHSAEDERDLSKVNFDLDLYEVYTDGYLEGAAGALTPGERAYLPWGAKLMTLECGMRFLTDYLEGDHYFATRRAGQNLDRCRTQFKLVSGMERAWDKMRKIAER